MENSSKSLVEQAFTIIKKKTCSKIHSLNWIGLGRNLFTGRSEFSGQSHFLDLLFAIPPRLYRIQQIIVGRFVNQNLALKDLSRRILICKKVETRKSYRQVKVNLCNQLGRGILTMSVLYGTCFTWSRDHSSKFSLRYNIVLKLP